MQNTDFTLQDVHSLMDRLGYIAEAEDYRDELMQLDCTNESEARMAIRKWLVPAFEENWMRSSCANERIRRAFLVALSRWGGSRLSGNSWN